MNKKIISTILAALMIAGSTSFTAFAVMNKGTVLIGHNAFSFEYANDPSNFNEITDAIVLGGAVYVKNYSGVWVDNNTGLVVAASLIPAVVYKSATETTNFDAQDKDVVVHETLKITSVSTVNISKNTGDVYTLPKTVTVTLANGSTKELAVIWDKVADTKVAGTFTYIGTLTMVDGVVNTDNVTVTTKLIVADSIIKVASVSLNKTTDNLTVGNTDTLTATIVPSNAANKDVTWTTSNSNVATVSNGVVTALAGGTTNITATTVDGSKIANCSVTVNNKLGYVNNNLLGIDLKARSNPDANLDNILGPIFKYEKIEILDTVIGTDNQLWDKIMYKGSVAYVSDPYIQHYTSPSDSVVLIAKNITKQFEVGPYDQIAWNFDGQGLSLGYLQWCIGQGTLQPLLNRMDREYNTVDNPEMKNIFGTNYDEIHNMINTPAEQSNWAIKINDATNEIKESWNSQFVNLTKNENFIKIEKDAEVFYVNKAMGICNDYDLETVRGFALAFDIAVQNGSISPAAKNIIDAELTQTPNMIEKDLLGVIANAVAGSSDDIRSRKMAIVKGYGTVHEITLDLDNDKGLSDTNWR